MTRAAIIGAALACLLALAIPPRAADAQPPPPATRPPPAQPNAQPRPVQSIGPAARARLRTNEAAARRKYGRRSPMYYRRLVEELKAVTPPSAPRAPDAAQPLIPPQPGAAPFAFPRQLPRRLSPLMDDKIARLIASVAIADVERGEGDTFSVRVARNLPSNTFLPPPAPPPIVTAAGPTAAATERGNLVASAMAATGGRGIAGAVSTIRAPVRPGLKDRVAGLDFIATALEESAVDRDPNDPYPDTVALGTLAPGAREPREDSLCSGVLVGRNETMGAVLTAAHCVCTGVPKTHVFIGYNVMRTPSCTRAPDFDSFQIVDSRTLRPDACSGASARRGGDIALVFFRHPTPGKRSYFLDAVIDTRTAIVPDPGMMQLLAGLTELEEMQERAVRLAEKWAKSLGLDPDDGDNDLKARAEFQAMVGALMVTKPPVGLTAVGFGATARSGTSSTSGCKGWAHFTQKNYVRCDAAEGPDAGDCVEGNEFTLLDPDEGPNDTCNGDSGGPIYAETTDSNRRYVRYLVGLTSRAAQKQRPGDRCGQGGIYSLLARNEVIDFLQSALKAYGMAPKIEEWSKALPASSQGSSQN